MTNSDSFEKNSRMHTTDEKVIALSKTKILLLIAAACAFVVGGLWMLQLSPAEIASQRRFALVPLRGRTRKALSAPIRSLHRGDSWPAHCSVFFSATSPSLLKLNVYPRIGIGLRIAFRAVVLPH